MAILRAKGLELSFGAKPLLDQVNLTIQKENKIALVGRNGTGKSSLLKVIAGKLEKDAGELQHSPELRIRYLSQALPEVSAQSVFDYVAEGLGDIRQALDRYEYLLEKNPSAGEVNSLHSFLERTHAWNWQQRVDRTLSRLDLNANQSLDKLSGGWRRRVALAQCLVSEPDLLLLDEPTNHLDLDTIEWLESVLVELSCAILFISHDRDFIDACADKIWDIDRGKLAEFDAPYQHYTEQKLEQLKIEEEHNALFDKRLAGEEQWIRQGIKARRTRNEGRVRALKQLREQRAERRQRGSTAGVAIKTASSSGKVVADLQDVSLSRGDKLLFQHLTTRVIKGDKIGLVGPNGCGKSSLLQLILGELDAQNGEVELGTQLKIAYFDQLKSSIDLSLSIRDNVGEGRDIIEVQGQSQHVISYLSDYGFPAERMQTPASALSGGEISRLALAKLFVNPANLLILDEPTNDLDIETLEVLENQVVEFAGTVIIISHDRRFLENTTSSLLVFQPNQEIVEITGGYQDWLRYRAAQQSAGEGQLTAVKTETKQSHQPKASTKEQSNQTNKAGSTKKLSYKLQRELDGLPKQVEELETAINELQDVINSPSFQAGSHQAVQDSYQQLSDYQNRLDELFERWEALELMIES